MKLKAYFLFQIARSIDALPDRRQFWRRSQRSTLQRPISWDTHDEVHQSGLSHCARSPSRSSKSSEIRNRRERKERFSSDQSTSQHLSSLWIKNRSQPPKLSEVNIEQLFNNLWNSEKLLVRSNHCL